MQEMMINILICPVIVLGVHTCILYFLAMNLMPVATLRYIRQICMQQMTRSRFLYSHSRWPSPLVHAVTNRNSCICSEYTAGEPPRRCVFLLRKAPYVHIACGGHSTLAYYLVHLKRKHFKCISRCSRVHIKWLKCRCNAMHFYRFANEQDGSSPLSGLCRCILCSVHPPKLPLSLSFCQSCQTDH